MKKNEKIPIRNIYYMLSYVYQTLSLSEYKKIDVENFHNVADLYSEIIKIGIPALIRGGLMKDYIRSSERTTVIRGKIDVNSSIKQNSLVTKKLIVLYDDLSENILLNQIIKAMLLYLIGSSKTSKENKKAFLGYLPYFTYVDNVELNLDLWKRVRYSRQSLRYQFIIDICRYLYEKMLFDTNSKNQLMQQLKDDRRLSDLYEKFVFAFYRRETKYRVLHSEIFWQVDDGYNEALPIMQTDMVLKSGNKVLIIDTKFYSNNMITRFVDGVAKQRSENLYQIFAYVNNWKLLPKEIIGGMLLYARTTSKKQPEHHYSINGNKLSVVNLNLNQKFESIKKQLISYVDVFFDNM